ncbi:hypothetical protein MB46_18200 [Arthrobacter alpinus]|uniref:hypothetical protein n=1 Tax=Arthrobacter alpinus TaxID=656366 RepID=UPI0005CB04C4|nr:hypothetical protein [Arthrobacter alpinus]ALV47132.1 hypothetical protein MB46_18200 [Arthrobacter alpinus]
MRLFHARRRSITTIAALLATLSVAMGVFLVAGAAATTPKLATASAPAAAPVDPIQASMDTTTQPSPTAQTATPEAAVKETAPSDPATQLAAQGSVDSELAGSVKAIDSANIITDPAWFTKAYADGFRLYVMHSTMWDSCTQWEHTLPQLEMALDAGLKIAVYTRDPNCWEAGIAAAGPYVNRLQFFALDVEDGGVPVTRAMVDGVAATGVRPVIYTGSGMWGGLQGATADSFSDVPLWDTDTSAFPFESWQPDHLAPAPLPYGGWNTPGTMRIASQQQFEFNYNGVAIDLNSFDASFLTVP